MRRDIEPLPFQRRDRPWLGLEIFRLSELYARSERGELGDTLFIPQRPQFHVVFLGLRGAGETMVDFAPVPIGARWLSVVAKGRVRQFTPGRDGVDAWMLIFGPELVADLALSILSPLWPQPALPFTGAARTEILALAAQLATEHARPHDALQPALLASLCRALLLRAERLQTGWSPYAANPALARFFTMLERDHATTRSVAHFARAAALSPRRLGELLLAATGKTTKQVIDERVVLEQKRLLAHTDVSVKELAARTGFDEPTNLVKFFRHHTGTTPGAFRDAQRTFLPSGRRS